jgi:hypothetical protein
MDNLRSLDEYRNKYVPLQAVELKENPTLAEVVGPLYTVPDDEPDDAA